MRENDINFTCSLVHFLFITQSEVSPLNNEKETSSTMIKERLVATTEHDENDDERQDEDKWQDIFPHSVQTLKNIFLSTKRFRLVKYVYYFLGCFQLLFGVALVFTDKGALDNQSASIAFMVFFFIQFIVYLYLPFYYLPFIRDMFISKDIKFLFQEVVGLSSFKDLQFKYRSFFYVNTGLAAASSTMYIVFRDADWPNTLFSVMWFFFYILPITVIFGFIVCLLESHRVQAMHLKKKLFNLRMQYEAARESSCESHSGVLVNSSSLPEEQQTHMADTDMTVFRDSSSSGVGGVTIGALNSLSKRHVSRSSDVQVAEMDELLPLLLSIEDVTRQYLHLHDAFRCTSDKRGFFIFSSFLIPLMVLLSSIWSIYEEFFSFNSTVGFIIMSLLYLLEIGLMVATVNENGYLVCRDISSFLLRILIYNSSAISCHQVGLDSTCSSNSQRTVVTATVVNQINGFVSCLEYVKIEIPFFGNFSLRSRTLLAIVATLLGAIIPGIIRSAM